MVGNLKEEFGFVAIRHKLESQTPNPNTDSYYARNTISLIDTAYRLAKFPTSITIIGNEKDFSARYNYRYLLQRTF